MTRIPKLALIALAILLLAACGSTSVADGTATDNAQSIVSTDSGEFLAADVIHDIAIEMADDDYSAAIDAYAADESKEWIHATVTIDGVVYEDVGIRLKGNSSLFALRGEDRTGPGGTADADYPESLPWLIRLDKYVDGQDHNGISDIVVRSNNSATALNEAVALELLDLAGLASQDSAYAALSVNGSDAVLRLIMEHPDDTWMTNQFSATGILYKAEATGDYSYRGEDPESYDEVFDVEAGDEDLSPLIDFLDFINNSDDETFYAELEQRLDTDSFATYLAMQELIANADDIDGRGNNSYLYFDTMTGVFTVVAWDHNLAFGTMGGGNVPGGEFTHPDRGTQPGTTDAGPGADFSEIAAERQPAGPGGRPGGAPGGPEAGNVLVDRFLADSDYAALYSSEVERLSTELYESGLAENVLDEWVSLLETSDLVEPATLSSEAAAIRNYFS